MRTLKIQTVALPQVFLIKGLAVDADFFGDAKKYLIQMLDKGMYPNAATYTAVLEGLGRQEDKKAEEVGKDSLEVMMAKGFVSGFCAILCDGF
ncbi:hypothetical protein ACLB2K_073825 [Fragaria x ananassa]